MHRIILLTAILMASSCKPDPSQDTEISISDSTLTKTELKAERETTKKLLRELNNLENSIQEALALSQIAAKRSGDARIKKLAQVVAAESDPILQEISHLISTANTTIPQSRNTKARSVEKAFATMPSAELDQKYSDWIAKFIQGLNTSHKSIRMKNVMQKTALLDALKTYSSVISSSH